MPAVGSIERPYAECREEILDGDVCIWAPTLKGFWTKIRHFIHKPMHAGIQDVTASRFIHAALFGWLLGQGDGKSDRLLLGEFTQKKGGVLTLARSQIRGESGNWHVFRPTLHDALQRRQAWLNMVELTGTPYSMAAIWRNVLRSLPVIRWFAGQRADERDSTTWGAATCSASVCQSLRLVGYDPISGDSWSDPVPNKSDYLVSPADLVHSPALKYLWTILWEE